MARFARIPMDEALTIIARQTQGIDTELDTHIDHAPYIDPEIAVTVAALNAALAFEAALAAYTLWMQRRSTEVMQGAMSATRAGKVQRMMRHFAKERDKRYQAMVLPAQATLVLAVTQWREYMRAAGLNDTQYSVYLSALPTRTPYRGEDD